MSLHSENKPLSAVGKLMIVPTPLGNLGDMTPRGLEALRTADIVYAEDTRTTAKLLSAFGIKTHIARLDENIMDTLAEQVIDEVLGGRMVAYCTDAGMPGVSDPGLRLVSCARKHGANVEVLPGATAVCTAYVASGFTNPRFYFGGFFPRKKGEATALLESLASLDAVLIFYESPKRIVSALSIVSEALPMRRVSVCRELTKVHEEVLIGSASEIRDLLSARQENEGIKGEMVFCIDCANALETKGKQEDSVSDASKEAVLMLKAGIAPKEAVLRIKERFGIPRNTAYEIVLNAKIS